MRRKPAPFAAQRPSQRPSLAEVMRLVSSRSRVQESGGVIEDNGGETEKEGSFSLLPPISPPDHHILTRPIQEEIDFDEYLKRKRRH